MQTERWVASAEPEATDATKALPPPRAHLRELGTVTALRDADAERAGDAPVVVALSAVADRVVPRFGALSGRLIDMEVGHVAQNVSLQAVALGVCTVVVAAIREAELAAALRLPEGERPIYVMPVGRAG